jgi:hypothetical protein
MTYRAVTMANEVAERQLRLLKEITMAAAGKKNLSVEKKWQGSKSTSSDQSKVARRPSGATAKSSKKKIGY